MSSSTHQIKVKAVDNTASGFRSISSKAKSAGASIKKYIGAGIAAAGAYMGTREIVGAINELGSLSDIAQRTSTTVEELTQATQAFNILGIQNMGIEQFSKALDRMQKNVGKQGMAGFYETLQSLASIDDIGKRTSETMRIFGEESGAFLTPLVEGAKNGVTNLKEVVDLMPKINTAAANSGDAAADALSNITNALSVTWKNLIGSVVSYFDTQFAGGIREASMKAVAYIEYFGKYTKNTLKSVNSFINKTSYNTTSWFGIVKSLFTGEKYYGKAYEPTSKPPDGWQKTLTDELKAKLEKIEKVFNKAYSNAAKTPQTGKKYLPPFEPKNDPDTSVEDALKWLEATESNTERTRIMNSLIYGNTNEATKLAALGPELREAEKQTKLLEDIAKNTKTTNNTIQNSGIGNSLIIREIN